MLCGDIRSSFAWSRVPTRETSEELNERTAGVREVALQSIILERTTFSLSAFPI